jgi:acyl-CoA thioesterase-1
MVMRRMDMRRIDTGGIAATLIKWLLLVAIATATSLRAEAAPVRLLVLGDSIGAGYGLAREQSFPARLAADLGAAGHPVEILDASVSGDTSAGGLARTDDAIGRHPDAVLLELGANDALRGIDPRITYANLDRILTRFGAAHIPVLILGMRAPGNWGRDYQTAFDAIYPRLAAAHRVALYPFLLDGVALDPKLNQADLLHPNAAGADLIARKLVPDTLRLIATR